MGDSRHYSKVSWREPAIESALRALWAKGLTGTEIGLRFGVSRGAVLAQARRLNLPRRDHLSGRPRRHAQHGEPPGPSAPRPLDGRSSRIHKPKPDAALRQAIAKAPPPITTTVQGHAIDRRFQPGFAGQKARVSVLQLERHHCRFPIDMPDGATWYCGDTRHQNSSYCSAHRARCENHG